MTEKQNKEDGFRLRQRGFRDNLQFLRSGAEVCAFKLIVLVVPDGFRVKNYRWEHRVVQHSYCHPRTNAVKRTANHPKIKQMLH